MISYRDREQRIATKRAYDYPNPEDGYRVFVDRLWPRGLSRKRMALDEHVPELAPSVELRKWFHTDPQRWTEFKQCYQLELCTDEIKARAKQLLSDVGNRKVTLVYGAKDFEHNHAVVLQHFLLQLVG